MVRDTLYITVPSYFRCPISMDVMKSPVSLCTGVTYDRSSIQHWLESGHDTCPATNQPLPSKDFVPNLTLHRLINLWSLPPHSGAPTFSRQQLRVLVSHVASRSDNWRESLSKIVEYASRGGDNRKVLADLDGFAAAIVAVLRDCDEIEVSEAIVRVLDSILLEDGVREQLQKLILKSNHDYISPIVSILREGNAKSKVESARVLEAIAIDAESKRKIGEKEGLLSALLQILRSEKDSASDDAVLSCLIAASATRSIKTGLVQSGVVEIVRQRLSGGAAVTEKCLKLVAAMATVAEGRAAISEIVGEIVERMMKAREEAVGVVWSMCCLYRDGKAQEAVRRSNGVTKILVVMQSCSDGDGKMRKMCGELVKVLGVGCNPSALGSYQTKTAHIMPY